MEGGWGGGGMPAPFWLPLIFTAVFKGFQFSSSLAPNLPNPFSDMEVLH